MKYFSLFLLTIFTVSVLYCQEKSPATQVKGKKIIATVLGQEISASDSNQIRGLIFRPLLDKYAEEQKIVPTPEEIDTFMIMLRKKQLESLAEVESTRSQLQEELKSPSLSKNDRAQAEANLKMTEQVIKGLRDIEKKRQEGGREFKLKEIASANQYVKTWKIYCSLYEKYGGRVIFQQLGPEPLDAFRDFLEDGEKNGDFQITDKNTKESFWNYFLNESLHKFYPLEDGKKLMSTPWWMMEEPMK